MFTVLAPGWFYGTSNIVAFRTPCHHQEEEGQPRHHLQGPLKVRGARQYLEEVYIWPQVS